MLEFGDKRNCAQQWAPRRFGFGERGVRCRRAVVRVGSKRVIVLRSTTLFAESMDQQRRLGRGD